MEKQKYYIGIDAGSNSVGWAVTTPDYKLVKKAGKTLWGVRLFEEAQTGVKRRLARSARRRRDRQNFRHQLLRELFAEEISKVDPGFYLRLDESKFWADDKTSGTKYCLFADEDFNDQAYQKRYPTIYHLRRELMNSSEPHDVRLLYLAVNHILKHRGNFLYPDMKVDQISPDFAPLWESFCLQMADLCEVDVVCEDFPQLQEILKSTEPITVKKKKLKGIIRTSDEDFTCIGELLSGGTVNVAKSFGIELDTEEKNALKISLSGEDLENDEKLVVYHQYLGDKFQVILDLKDLYDWGLLKRILGDSSSISEAKCKAYEQHTEDLQRLKTVIRQELPDQYGAMFRTVKSKYHNYCAYTGHYDNRKQKDRSDPCTQEEFCKFTAKMLAPCESQFAREIKADCEAGTFMPLQRTKDNGVIPYQMHFRELQLILDRAQTCFPFLTETDGDGITVREKIESLILFRVPYYVGPLDNTNAKDGAHWAEKKTNERVLPWNFERVVDLEQSAENFMNRLTNTCTYLIGEPVLPKDSIAYSRYMVLNELNNVRVYGEPLPVPLKQELFETLFLNKNQVKQSDLMKELKRRGLLKKDEGNVISGIDGDFKGSLRTERRLREIFGEQVPRREILDEIILSILLLKQEPEMLKNRIRRIYPPITDAQLSKVCRLNCSGWGRLSKAFLLEVQSEVPGQGTMGILDALWNTQKNLMQLLSGELGFHSAIDQRNRALMKDTKLDYSVVEEMNAPPYVRRTVWQTMRIVKEIRKIMGGDPDKVFIEMAKGPDGSGRTKSRKTQLMECYQSMGEEMHHWCDTIDRYSEDRLRQDKLYLYFTQMGRCMYTYEKIDLDALLNDTGNQIYDIDHIWPRCKVKDDSLSNRVLVLKRANMEKGDQYPVKDHIRKSMYGHWKILLDHKLIDKTKFERLTRVAEFTDEELAGFVNRQLVETRQSTKLLGRILEQALPNSEIVYVKAGNVSDFRQTYHLVKVRDVNDYHHAKDAYLNVVVGNVFHEKFTKNPLRFIQQGGKYSMKPEVLFHNEIRRGGKVIWRGSADLDTVCAVHRKNNIMITRQTYRRTRGQNGGLFDQNPVCSGKIPLSGDSRHAKVERYGGYNTETTHYFFLVEHQPSKKRVRSLEPLYLRYGKRVEEDPDYLLTYSKEVLHLKEPKIIVPEIQLNSLIRFKNFPMYISGTTGICLLGKQAFQLVLDEKQLDYLKGVLKICDRIRKKEAVILHPKIHKISAQENLALYDALVEKMQIPSYASRPGSQTKTLLAGRKQFETLELIDQCRAIEQILKLFRSNGSADLTLVNGSGRSGIIQPSKNISDAQLVVQSVTGFYEQTIDLMGL